MATDIRTSELKEPVDVAEYLFRRLHEIGIRSIHGVPGDYNLVALDYITKNGLNWVGNCNELNAGYAADGYARVKGMSAIVTTFGVGELSAVNALAGAYSEYVPVVHIVGVPSTLSQRDGMLLHHTLGNGDFNVFANMSRQISCAVAPLNDPHDAAALIDNAIRECWLQSRPVYVTLPTDVVQKKVEGARLKTKLDLDFPPNDKEKEDYVVEMVLKRLQEAKNPVILVDACAIRHRALEEVHALVHTTNLPVFVTPMGKSAINETLPNYGGVYAGDGSNAGVATRIEAADLVLSIGAIKSDFNTSGFTYRVSQLNTIDFHSHMVRVRYSEYPGVRMNGVLKKLVDKIQTGDVSVHPGPVPNNDIPHSEISSPSPTITQAWFWPRLGQWLRPKDVVITETGTANFGIWETRFPEYVTAISQVLWGSIGYATGACQGAAMAVKELDRGQRTILFTGDGSFQLTAQEVSTCLRNKLNPIIFVINNDGYTIERFIHGMEDAYNDVQPWNYTSLPLAFGSPASEHIALSVKTKDDVEKLFSDEAFATSDKLRFVEILMEKDDAPQALKLTAAASAKTNERKE
ncbi:pyruvate decarboxylase [Aulographum hederae CBS 113979]|uniref:Pyruvate decarboxylase n=1 Tax=Aulographum hederae CBS 113979 TaxID=1176131 RepID=A0A6G1H511_9PEZI|nr:pyruvate decarboxylase [Aulographum hederae CBS 113979]